MSPRTLARLQLAVVLAVAAAGAVGLHAAGSAGPVQVDWADPAGWLALATPEQVVVALARLVGLGCAWWLLASTVVYTLACLTRLPRAVRALGWTTLPAVRRLADRAVAATLVGSSALGGGGQALAAERGPPIPPPVVVQADDEERVDDDTPGWYVPTPAGAGEASEEPGDDAPDGLVEPADEGAGVVEDGWQHYAEALPGRGAAGPSSGAPQAREDDAAAHTVAAGEHLWGIAAARLRAVWGREPTDAETAGYWREVIAGNTGRLASGDPDLIYPGEVLELPEAPARPDRKE